MNVEDFNCPSCRMPIILGQGHLGGCPMNEATGMPLRPGIYTVIAHGHTFDRAEYWFRTEQEARDAYTEHVNAGCAVYIYAPDGALIAEH